MALTQAVDLAYEWIQDAHAVELKGTVVERLLIMSERFPGYAAYAVHNDGGCVSVAFGEETLAVGVEYWLRRVFFDCHITRTSTYNNVVQYNFHIDKADGDPQTKRLAPEPHGDDLEM